MSAFKKLATNLIVALLLFVVTSVAMAASGQPMLKTSVSSGDEYAERLLAGNVNGSAILVAQALQVANRIGKVSVAQAAEYLKQTEVRPCPAGTRKLSSVLPNGQLGMVSRPYRDSEFCLWDRNTGTVVASAGCGNIDLERAPDAMAVPERVQEPVFFATTPVVRPTTSLPQGSGGTTVVYNQQGGMSTGTKVGLVAAGVVGAVLIHRALDKPRTVINNSGTCAGANFSVNGNNNATCGSVVVPVPTPVVCNPPSQLVGNTCVAPQPQCAGGQILVGNVCQCPSGQQWNGVMCQTPVQYCLDGSVRPANGQCPLVCTGGRIDVGGFCSCPVGQQWNGTSCQQPPPSCRFDQILVGNTCQCPVGQQEVGGRCQNPPLQCSGGQIPMGNTCRCPPGQELFGNICRVPLPGGGGQQPITCSPGEVLFAGTCRIPLPGGGG